MQNVIGGLRNSHLGKVELHQENGSIMSHDQRIQLATTMCPCYVTLDVR